MDRVRASSLVVISHFPSPLNDSETLIGPSFQQVIDPTASPSCSSAEDITDLLPLLSQISDRPPPPAVANLPSISSPTLAHPHGFAYGTSSLLIISHFPSPLYDSETLIGPSFQQVIDPIASPSCSTADDIVAVRWSSARPSDGEITAAVGDCVFLFCPDSATASGQSADDILNKDTVELHVLYNAALNVYMDANRRYKQSIRSQINKGSFDDANCGCDFDQFLESEVINKGSFDDANCGCDFDQFLESEVLKHTRALLILSYDFKSAWNSSGIHHSVGSLSYQESRSYHYLWTNFSYLH
ncbi:uncharacterized protein A4U43_C07F24610 [Asparagus officinalis]|uniref:Uncharacterized protein n=1 Tax=Asparagus officinalis TaxID=4686 RepID=A0A5P1EEK6_ASPOF|nr:uncharacterized protein A4U43_C07F24610 [Asparagus officinalis]